MNKTYSIEVWNETTIYLGIQDNRNSKITDFVAILSKNGWLKKQNMVVKTDCCKMDEIWTKKTTTTGLHTIALPIIEAEEFFLTVFITGMIFRYLMKISLQ